MLQSAFVFTAASAKPENPPHLPQSPTLENLTDGFRSSNWQLADTKPLWPGYTQFLHAGGSVRNSNTFLSAATCSSAILCGSAAGEAGR